MSFFAHPPPLVRMTPTELSKYVTEQIYLSAPDVTELEAHAVADAVRGGWVAPIGPDVDAFEREIAERVGVNHGVALASGTAALHLGLLTLGAGPGDVVVTATMTFAATAFAISHAGATPYFVDCLPDTGNIDPALLRSALAQLRKENRRVAAVVPVDLLGKAADYTAILAIAEEFDVPVLADAAESLGATHNGAAAGSFGAASILSFNGNKIITTSNGGMLLTDDADLARRVRYLATQARQPVRHYEHEDVGYNYRLSNVLAALGRAQLSRLDAMIARRRMIRDSYKSFFSDVPGVDIFGVQDDDADNVWLTAISLDEAVCGWSPDTLATALDEHKIESRPVWKPMHLQPVYAGSEGVITGVSQRLFETHLALPSGSSMTDAQHERVLSVLAELFKR